MLRIAGTTKKSQLIATYFCPMFELPATPNLFLKYDYSIYFVDPTYIKVLSNYLIVFYSLLGYLQFVRTVVYNVRS